MKSVPFSHVGMIEDLKSDHKVIGALYMCDTLFNRLNMCSKKEIGGLCVIHAITAFTGGGV